MARKLKRFKRFAGHYEISGPKKVHNIETRPQNLDKIVYGREAQLRAASRYHDSMPHPYHPSGQVPH